LKRAIGLLKNQPQPDVERDLLRLIELTLLLGPEKGKDLPLVDLKSLLLARFSTAADSPANREIARLLAFLDEPGAVVAILAHQANVPDHAAQIHDAYCLRAMKHGWTARAKEQLWAWYEAASRWEGVTVSSATWTTWSRSWSSCSPNRSAIGCSAGVRSIPFRPACSSAS